MWGMGDIEIIIFFEQTKQTRILTPYTAAQGELKEGGTNARGTARPKSGTRRHCFFFLTCIRDQGTARSRNDTAVRKPPNEHVRIIS